MTGSEEEAEVLGLPVDGAQHPEEDLSSKEVSSVFIGGLGTQQNAHDRFDSRATVRLIFLRRGDTHGLTEIFLGQPDDPGPVGGQASIEALDDEGLLGGEPCNWTSAESYAICIQHMNRRAPKSDPVALRRGAARQWVLKPQDIAVALKLVVLGPERLAYAALGKAMHLSQFEAHAAVQRLIAAKLAVSIDGTIRPIAATLRRFLINGAPYAYPPIRGEVVIGTPTAYAVQPLKDKFGPTSDLPPVWPDPNGSVRGQTLLPLYPGLPSAAKEDSQFYELVALLDALRIGQAREREMAGKMLEARIK